MRHHFLVGFISGEARFVGPLVALRKDGLIMECQELLVPGTIGRLGIPVGADLFRAVAMVRCRIAHLGLHFRFIRMSSYDRMLLRRLIQKTRDQ